jgi:hypothetical protein
MKDKDQILLEKTYDDEIRDHTRFHHKPMPKDWDKGFEYPIKIGANGHEVPFQKDNNWYLRVWNAKTKKHYLYSYSEDMYYPDTHFMG